jgi:thermitase
MLRFARCTILAVVGLCAGAALAPAAEKSFTVRGQRVRLVESDDTILVRSKGLKGVVDVAAQAISAQAKALGEEAPRPQALLAKRPAQYVKVLAGVLVPKLEGLRAAHHDDILAASDTIDSVQTVYRVGARHVVPLETCTVRFKGALNPRQLFAVASEFELEEMGRPKSTTALVRYRVPAGADVFAVCEKLAAKGFVAWAEPDLAVQLNFAADNVELPNDPRFSDQWHMQPGEGGVQVPEAWQLSRGTSDITVAVIDSGIDLQHRDLQPNLVAGYDFVERDEDPQPDTGDASISPHGTVCAGMVAAVTGNGRGIAGPAPNAKIMPVRIAATDGFVTMPDIAESLRWSATQGAKILSCSWTTGAPSNQVADAIDEVTVGGCLVFVAAGNSGPDGEVGYPAQFENAIAVGATTRDRKLADFSSFAPGKLVDLCAPGADILSSDMLGKEGYFDGGADAQPDENGEHPGDYVSGANGTSYACPMAAGVAALVWSTYPKLTHVQVRQVLQETAFKIDPDEGAWNDEGYSDRYGHGQVNALAALSRAREVAGEDGSQSPPQSNLPYVKVRVGPPADTREILGRLLRLQRELDNAGRPKLAKELPNPKTIDLREFQLDDALAPQPQSYVVRGREIVLQPSKEWFALSLDDAGEVKGPQFWQIVRGDATDEQLAKINIAAKEAGRIAVIAPRELLRERKQLDDFVRAGTLPAVYATYEQGGSLLVPLGTLTLRVDKKGGEAAHERALAEGKSLGLRLVEREGDIVRFAQTNISKPASLFTAANTLAKVDGVLWCEPDFASRPLVLPK